MDDSKFDNLLLSPSEFNLNNSFNTEISAGMMPSMSVSTNTNTNTVHQASYLPNSSKDLSKSLSLHANDNLYTEFTIPSEKSLQSKNNIHTQSVEELNKSMRISTHAVSTDGSTISLSGTSKIWTQHEIVIQRSVHRRGGELSAITAAGSKGRIKPPYRRSRMERMNSDLERIYLQENQISMSIEDPFFRSDVKKLEELKNHIHLEYKFLKYQYDHFQSLSEGGLIDLEKAKKAIQLLPGQPLESDEKLSMSLEDRMITKIQKLLRKKFGKAFRKKLIEKRNKAALKIQTLWRKQKLSKPFRLFYYGTRLSNFVRNLYKRSYASENTAELSMIALRGHAAKFIQRVYRGCIGKKITKMRKAFMLAIAELNARVSYKELIPSHLEELGEEVEYFIKDYTRNLPIEIISIIRAVLYMTNGDEPEIFTIEVAGVLEKIEVYARDLAWNGVKHILRRKGCHYIYCCCYYHYYYCYYHHYYNYLTIQLSAITIFISLLFYLYFRTIS